MRILVQNLTRLGDLLQSQPALAGLAAQGHTLAVACLENFAGAARLLPEATAVFPLPGAGLLAGLAGDWRVSLGLFTEFTDRVRREFSPEAVVNLTSAVSARLLARRFCGDAVTGFTLDALGYRLETSPWAVFLEASSSNRGLSPFNIVDLFRKTAGVGQGRDRFALARPGREEMAVAEARLREAVPGAAGYVGFQLGASAAARQWPVAAFARLGDALWERHGLAAVLLGAPGETGLATAYRQAATAPAVDLVGRTSLPELAAALCAVRLLVTNDTGTLHLAAGLDLPSVALFFATAQPFDTGPYRPGCLCLEPDMPCHPCGFGRACPRDNACLGAIAADTVLGAVEAFLATGEFPAGDYPGARAWRSAFDGQGFMDLVSLSGHDGEPRAVWLRLQRLVLRQFLDGTTPDTTDFPPAVLPEAMRQTLATELGQASDLLRLLAGQAGLMAKNAAMKSRFLASWERLTRLLLASPHLAVLGHLWQRRAQDPGRDLPTLLGHVTRFSACVEAFRRLVDRS